MENMNIVDVWKEVMQAWGGEIIYADRGDSLYPLFEFEVKTLIKDDYGYGVFRFGSRPDGTIEYFYVAYVIAEDCDFLEGDEVECIKVTTFKEIQDFLWKFMD